MGTFFHEEIIQQTPTTCVWQLSGKCMSGRALLTMVSFLSFIQCQSRDGSLIVWCDFIKSSIVVKHSPLETSLTLKHKEFEMVFARWKQPADQHLWGAGKITSSCKAGPWQTDLAPLAVACWKTKMTSKLFPLNQNVTFISSLKHPLFADLFSVAPTPSLSLFCVGANVPSVYTA